MFTIFVRFNEVTKKLTTEQPSNFQELVAIFRDKFEGLEDFDEKTMGPMDFYIEDNHFHVIHKLEDFSDISEGSVIEAKMTNRPLKRHHDETKPTDRSERSERGERGGRHSPGASSSHKGRSRERERARERDSSVKRRKIEDKPVENDGKCIVRIRGMPWQAGEEDIRSFFSGIDMVETDPVFIVLNQQGRNTGEAFVRYLFLSIYIYIYT